MLVVDPSAKATHDALAVRRQSRDGRLTGPTAGLAPGFVQANLAILPAALADDFLRFCQRNPKTWTCAPTFRAIAYGSVASWWLSRWTSAPIGRAIW